jgi:hydroxymethylpyrimidine/phosphomethylpyrimidine kinase
VRAIAEVDPAFVAQQIDSVMDDFDILAAKTGMLARAAVVEAVADRLAAHRLPNLVVDPVMVATSGDLLMDSAAVASLGKLIFPLARLITPNLHEAEVLSGLKIESPKEMREAARALAAMGPQAVLVKGGHLRGDAIDILYDKGSLHEFIAKRVGQETHGTGCTLSAAIAAKLALGAELPEAVEAAKRYVTRAIETAPKLGRGRSPLNHGVPIEKPQRS